MICKYYLMIGEQKVDINSYSCMEVSNLISNISDIAIRVNRKNLNGAVRSFNSGISFVGDARNAIISLYNVSYYSAKAAFAIYAMNNDWTYSKVWECPLDFSTLSYDDYKCKISCIDTSAAAVINSKKSVKYEFNVENLREQALLYYDGVEIQSKQTYDLQGETVDGLKYKKLLVPNLARILFAPKFYMLSDYISPLNKSVLLQDQDYSYGAVERGGLVSTYTLTFIDYDDLHNNFLAKHGNHTMDTYFLEALEDCNVTVDFSKLEVTSDIAEGIAENLGYVGFVFLLYKRTADGNWELIDKQKIYDNYTVDGETFSRCKINNNYDLKKGERLQLAMSNLDEDHLGEKITAGYVNPIYSSKRNNINLYLNNSEGEINWNNVGAPVYLNVISPFIFLDEILNKMFDGTGTTAKGKITTTIGGVSNKRLLYTLLCAAESARQMKDAKIYSSFQKFADYMSAVFGYIYAIEETPTGYVVNFKHRSEVFNTNVIKTLSNIAEAEYSVVEGRIYSDVEVGYDKQDYDNGNSGYDEYNTTSVYSSGETIKDGTLSLISPYRADCYGFEELVESHEKADESTSSDTDIFLINVKPTIVDGKYIIDRDIRVLNAYSRTVFNAKLAPRFMVEANKGYIGMFTNKLTFASSDGYSDIKFDGYAVTDDITIDESLFTVGSITVSSADTFMPTDLDGLVAFEWQEKTYYGYIESVDFNFGRDEAVKYKLIEHKRTR